MLGTRSVLLEPWSVSGPACRTARTRMLCGQTGTPVSGETAIPGIRGVPHPGAFTTAVRSPDSVPLGFGVSVYVTVAGATWSSHVHAKCCTDCHCVPVQRKSIGTSCATRLERATQPDSSHVVVKVTWPANGIAGAGEPLKVCLSSARFKM